MKCEQVLDKLKHRWLQRARKLLALAQNGVKYAEGDYDLEGFREVKRIAAEMMAVDSGNNFPCWRNCSKGRSATSHPSVLMRHGYSGQVPTSGM